MFASGSLMREALENAMPGMIVSDALKRLGFETEKYILVPARREETIDLE